MNLSSQTDSNTSAGSDSALSETGQSSALGASAHRRALDQIYDEYCDARERNEPIGVETLCARFPQYAESIQRMIAVDCYIEERLSLLLEPSEPADWPEPGQELAGFVLVQELSRGGFARVYLAEEKACGGRPVVLKVSGLNGAEADTLGQLRHPNIVPIFSVHHLAERRLTAVCMPYEGRATLRDVRRRLFAGGRTPRWASDLLDAVRAENVPATSVNDRPDEQVHLIGTNANPTLPIPGRTTYVEGVVELSAQVADALACAHRQGVIHRDLKPENVLVCPNGRPLVLDFNLAFHVKHAVNRLGGTVPYMAPEQLAQFSSRDATAESGLDGRADVYSLGVILYELLTGRHPYMPESVRGRASGVFALAAEKQRLEIEQPSALNSGVDGSVSAIVMRCLAERLDDRPGGAGELAAELRRWLSLRRNANGWLARWKRPWALAALVLLGVGIAAAALIPGNPTPPTDAPASTEPAEPPAIRELRLGRDAFQAKNYANAVEHLTTALAHDPQQTDALILRGRAFQLLEDYVAAQGDYSKASNRNDDPKLTAQIGYCYQQQNRHDLAGSFYKLALQAGYDTPAVHNNLGYALLNQYPAPFEAEKKAQECFDVAIATDPNFGLAYLNRASLGLRIALARDTSFVAQATTDAEKALELGLDSINLRLTAAQLHGFRIANDESSRDRAIAHLSRAIELGANPNSFGRMQAFQRIRNDVRFAKLCQTAPVGEPVVRRQIVDTWQE